MSQLFISGGQSTGASASVLPMNFQDCFPLGLIGLISLQSKGVSSIFSSATIQSISSSALSLLYGPTPIMYLLCLKPSQSSPFHSEKNPKSSQRLIRPYLICPSPPWPHLQLVSPLCTPLPSHWPSQGWNQGVSIAQLLSGDSGDESVSSSFILLAEFISLWYEDCGPLFYAGCQVALHLQASNDTPNPPCASKLWHSFCF